MTLNIKIKFKKFYVENSKIKIILKLFAKVLNLPL